MHVSKLKRVVKFQGGSNSGLSVDSEDLDEFDNLLLLENSWEVELDGDEYEKGNISEVRPRPKTCYDRIHNQYLAR